MVYTKIIRPVLFKFDPELVHNIFTFYGHLLGKSIISRKLINLMFNYENEKLTQTIHGITFKNPVGLAAGFDKDARLMKIMPSIGFGFEEIGSITGEACKGNPKPRLWRLPKHKSIVVHYGLKNPGCENVAKILNKQKFAFPIGISVAKTNNQETCDPDKGIADYYKAFSTLEPYADYLTINVSCPNAFGGQPFTEPELLDRLLYKIKEIKTNKPIFIKLSPDLNNIQIDQIIELSNKHQIQGFILSNLSKDRLKTGLPNEEFKNVGQGGLSGKLVEKHANEMISYIYKKTQGKFVIIGCGGIFTAEDAYEKIKRGASLLQLITGIIYGGPAAIGKINRGLVKLLEKDGYQNISEAVGMYYKNRFIK